MMLAKLSIGKEEWKWICFVFKIRTNAKWIENLKLGIDGDILAFSHNKIVLKLSNT